MLKLRIKSNIPLEDPSNRNSITSEPLISISSKETVGTLKQKLRDNFRLKSNRYIRLIYSGRLLSPDDSVLTTFFLGNNYHNNEEDIKVVHCVIAQEGVKGGVQAKMSSSGVLDTRSGVDLNGRVRQRTRQSRFNHSSQMSDYDSAEDEENVPRRGFERLRNQGLSRSEVNALRIYFADQIHQFVQSRRNTLVEDQDEEVAVVVVDQDDHDPETALRNRRLQDEDEWMESQGMDSEFRLNLNSDAQRSMMGGRWRFRRQRPPSLHSSAAAMLTDLESNDQQSLSSVQLSISDEYRQYGATSTSLSGTDRDFIWGFVLAYVCGFIMMFWVMSPTVAHRQKLGILTGLCFHTIIHIFEREQASES